MKALINAFSCIYIVGAKVKEGQSKAVMIEI
jgi:hypothetical protein